MVSLDPMRDMGSALELVITGGAGFVGSSLALGLRARHPSWRIRAFDNLRRRGSELSVARLQGKRVEFVHGDVRNRADLDELGCFDVLIDCSAEPSVLAGLSGGPTYVVDTNLGGTLNCLEVVRRHEAGIMFLSTSRVYPIDPLERLPYEEAESRFQPAAQLEGHGWSSRGINEDFPLQGARSLYGATKLCSELMIQEYAYTYNLPAVIDRCGVLSGPWQMGKVDQGVIMHWVASHVFERPLRYIGYGGTGKQVRDVLHADELVALVDRQLAELETLRGDVFNIGGGVASSLSLRELTELCQAATGKRVPITSEPVTRQADLRIYLSDCTKACARFGFAPRCTPEALVEDIARWVVDQRVALERALFAT